jgi:outer membrane protein OmpA-like peptidoglycan-associated protein
LKFYYSPGFSEASVYEEFAKRKLEKAKKIALEVKKEEKPEKIWVEKEEGHKNITPEAKKEEKKDTEKIVALEKPPSEIPQPPQEIGERISFPVIIFFRIGSDRIAPEFFGYLNFVAENIKNTPGIKRVIINGYADDIGAKPYNLILSSKRACSVYNYLVFRGVPEEIMEMRAYGAENLIYSGEEKSLKGVNRRVEIYVEK